MKDGGNLVRIAAIALLCALLARPALAETRHSTDLGWTANQDVTEPFAKLL